MPYDTTYQVTTNKNSTIITATIPGGKDTLINCTIEELPKYLKNHPELVEYVSANTKKVEIDNKKENDQSSFLGVLMLAVILILSFKFDKILSWIQNRNHFKIPKAIAIILGTSIISCLLLGYEEAAVFLSIIFIITLIIFRNELVIVRKTINTLLTEKPAKNSKNTEVSKTIIQYFGTSLKFSNGEFESIFEKHFPYFLNLSIEEKKKFIHRTRKFITNKIFYLHTSDGFKEMPILVSAAAVQLTFGLSDYMLHYFKHIHIYPEEFYRANDLGICFLEGNVTGNKVSLSWKHFLHGYNQVKDGANVGLHEFAHALHYQKAIVEFDEEKSRYLDKKFYTDFTKFISIGDKAYQNECKCNTIYSEYALSNFQEFWAESVEIFFEKPNELKDKYPDLYAAISILLNQDLT